MAVHSLGNGLRSAALVRSLTASVCLGAALLGLLPCAWAQQSATPSALTLSLLAFSDFHGHLLPPPGSVLVPAPGIDGGARVAAGGAAYLATLVEQLKRQNPDNTLLVAAGDMIGASPLVSSLFHDEPTIDFLNQIGVRVSVVGNHEFDKGRTELLRLQNGGCYPKSADGKTGVVGVDTCMRNGQFKGASFQYLGANVIDQASGKPLFPPYAIHTLAGVKVGFIGVTLKETPQMVIPAGVAGLQFADEVATVNQLVPVLKDQGVTVIVLLLHQGGETTAKTLLDKSCPGFAGEIVNLVDRMDPAIDIVISGHTHQEYVCARPDGKLITQSGPNGRLLTKIDLSVDPISGKVIAKDANNKLAINNSDVKDASGRLLPTPASYTALAPDPGVEAIVRRYRDLAAAVSNVVIGRVSDSLDRRINVAGESTLGAVIADAFLAASSNASYGKQAAQIAFTNRGGIRSDLTSSLDVTFGQLYNVMPFNNNLVTMDLSGAQLLRLLEQQWEQPQSPGGRILSVSSGFGYSWDASQPDGAASGSGHRVVSGSMKLHGRPIEMDTTYRITVNNFMASGGDNFTVLQQGRRQQTGDIDSVVARAYFQTKGLVERPALNRISRLN